MTPLLRFGPYVLAGLALFASGWRVSDWRHAQADRKARDAIIEQLRAELRARDVEIRRRATVNAQTEQGYLNAIQSRQANLDSVRAELRAVRLRKSACPRVPEAAPVATAASEPDAAGGDGLPPDLAEMAGDRFARCDAVAIQLNALQEWVRQSR